MTRLTLGVADRWSNESLSGGGLRSLSSGSVSTVRGCCPVVVHVLRRLHHHSNSCGFCRPWSSHFGTPSLAATSLRR